MIGYIIGLKSLHVYFQPKLDINTVITEMSLNLATSVTLLHHTHLSCLVPNATGLRQHLSLVGAQ